MPAGYGQITWLEMNAAGLRLMVFSILNMLNGALLPGAVFVVLLPPLVWYYLRSLDRRSQLAAQESGGIAAASGK
jgi:hypothetical protein